MPRKKKSTGTITVRTDRALVFKLDPSTIEIYPTGELGIFVARFRVLNYQTLEDFMKEETEAKEDES